MKSALPLFLALVAAHFIADIPLNPAWLGRAKRGSRGARRLRIVLGHCLVVSFVSYLCILGWRSPRLVTVAAAAGVCHLLVDYARVWIEPAICPESVAFAPGGAAGNGRRARRRCLIVADQVAHLLCLLVIALLAAAL